MDFVKLDIEGGEYALFASRDWLAKTSALSMELHPTFGDSQLIVDALVKFGFDYTLANSSLAKVGNAREASFLYAWQRR